MGERYHYGGYNSYNRRHYGYGSWLELKWTLIIVAIILAIVFCCFMGSLIVKCCKRCFGIKTKKEKKQLNYDTDDTSSTC